MAKLQNRIDLAARAAASALSSEISATKGFGYGALKSQRAALGKEAAGAAAGGVGNAALGSDRSNRFNAALRRLGVGEHFLVCEVRCWFMLCGLKPLAIPHAALADPQGQY